MNANIRSLCSHYTSQGPRPIISAHLYHITRTKPNHCPFTIILTPVPTCPLLSIFTSLRNPSHSKFPIHTGPSALQSLAKSYARNSERESMARLMRWATDAGGRWQLDMESPVTMEGTARPVPLDPPSLLGLSRGPRITRTKQLDFMHRFMSSPLVPSFCAADGGLFMHHAHLKHLTEKLSATILEQFDMQRLLSSIKESVSKGKGEASWSEFISSRVRDIVTLGAATELQISSSTTLLVEAYDINREQSRGKAIFQHKANHL